MEENRINGLTEEEQQEYIRLRNIEAMGERMGKSLPEHIKQKIENYRKRVGESISGNFEIVEDAGDETERNKNYRNDSNKEVYKKFVENVHEYFDSKENASDRNKLRGTTSEECVSKFGIESKNLLEKSGVVLEDGWEVVDVMPHVVVHQKGVGQKGASIWISKNGNKWDGKVYELRPKEKIFQIQKGIDYSKFKKK